MKPFAADIGCNLAEITCGKSRSLRQHFLLRRARTGIRLVLNGQYARVAAWSKGTANWIELSAMVMTFSPSACVVEECRRELGFAAYQSHEFEGTR